MLPKKTTLVMQLCMTFMMALTMSGTLGFINEGSAFLGHWPRMFIIAWPIAFIYTRTRRREQRTWQIVLLAAVTVLLLVVVAFVPPALILS